MECFTAVISVALSMTFHSGQYWTEAFCLHVSALHFLQSRVATRSCSAMHRGRLKKKSCMSECTRRQMCLICWCSICWRHAEHSTFNQEDCRWFVRCRKGELTLFVRLCHPGKYFVMFLLFIPYQIKPFQEHELLWNLHYLIMEQILLFLHLLPS